jgi:hypothetical protein
MNPADIPLNRLYSDLAWLWPVMSPPEEYAEEAAHWKNTLRELLGPGRHEILELGVGGGHNLSHLTSDFNATAVDLSEPMLANSKKLNPTVTHIAGDMRSGRLGKKFRAVLIHDAISHITSEDDLLATVKTAAAHLESGGVFITTPDNIRDTFKSPRVESVMCSGKEFHLTCCEYTHDPDPGDTTIETIFTYLIEKEGRLQIEHDRMITGLFPLATWKRLIEGAGFAFETRSFTLSSLDTPYTLLVGRLRTIRPS